MLISSWGRVSFFSSRRLLVEQNGGRNNALKTTDSKSCALYKYALYPENFVLYKFSYTKWLEVSKYTRRNGIASQSPRSGRNSDSPGR